jgi:hypothetical protein
MDGYIVAKVYILVQQSYLYCILVLSWYLFILAHSAGNCLYIARRKTRHSSNNRHFPHRGWVWCEWAGFWRVRRQNKWVKRSLSGAEVLAHLDHVMRPARDAASGDVGWCGASRSVETSSIDSASSFFRRRFSSSVVMPG